ncbi:hypothetical protein SAURM35S_06780 [Streptomyces aurantiogriseus]
MSGLASAGGDAVGVVAAGIRRASEHLAAGLLGRGDALHGEEPHDGQQRLVHLGKLRILTHQLGELVRHQEDRTAVHAGDPLADRAASLGHRLAGQFGKDRATAVAFAADPLQQRPRLPRVRRQRLHPAAPRAELGRSGLHVDAVQVDVLAPVQPLEDQIDDAGLPPVGGAGHQRVPVEEAQQELVAVLVAAEEDGFAAGGDASVSDLQRGRERVGQGDLDDQVVGLRALGEGESARHAHVGLQLRRALGQHRGRGVAAGRGLEDARPRAVRAPVERVHREGDRAGEGVEPTAQRRLLRRGAGQPGVGGFQAKRLRDRALGLDRVHVQLHPGVALPGKPRPVHPIRRARGQRPSGRGRPREPGRRRGADVRQGDGPGRADVRDRGILVLQAGHSAGTGQRGERTVGDGRANTALGETEDGEGGGAARGGEFVAAPGQPPAETGGA